MEANLDIRILKFWQGSEMGKEGEYVPCDYVSWQPRFNSEGGAPYLANTEKVRRLNPDNVHLPEGADGGDKLMHMNAIWSVIGPAYEAWKQGMEIPENGTALGIWNALSPEDIEAFRAAGIKTVEEVRDLTENQAAKVRIPNARAMRHMAKLFLDNMGASAAAEREAQKDLIIADMAERMAAMEEMLKEKMQAPLAAEGQEEIDILRTELDRAGVQYDKRWGANKLREALNAKEAA
jgi:hypothetical protein